MKNKLVNLITEVKSTHPIFIMENFSTFKITCVSEDKIKEIVTDYTNSQLSILTQEFQKKYIEKTVKNCERELIELGYKKTKNNFVHPNANFLEKFYYAFF